MYKLTGALAGFAACFMLIMTSSAFAGPNHSSSNKVYKKQHKHGEHMPGHKVF